ncbi:hypothetical protein ACI3LY_003388 [Candidozyma auris]|uniref:54S ribosomal protein L20, mitochondrial n=1 Tax=Candidozyma auris TaxID=498019 RepID=A0A2H0ZUT6_CANAR|nr:hypothetical_protein [[Candida] auris]KNE02658.2 hypothetical protein QG37_00030 [[Candida] auris]PIS52468.1 hypothetical protein B9J08_004085 [[Candida] auris]PIS54449.1 hypothetical protein CJI97_004153 [[Candida] auris]PSK79333.1 hypothetical protein CJJ07_000836 [[Candida] auris]QEO21762.1 hypothetical_protein [[Candida] auris]
MFKSAVRRYSLKSLPYEAQPKNKYNAQRSAFNLKPVRPQGLIYNPPASAPTYRETPKLFLPKNDPRLKILEGKWKVYSEEELDNMPLIYGIKKEKDYSLTPEVVGEILKLRRENPDEWTVPKLAKKFNVDKVKVNVISGISKERQEKVLQELEEVKSTWSAKRKLARQDREKRTQQWLRGEF